MSPQEYRNEGYRIYEEDMEKAVELFEKAARGKDIPAAVALAAYYYDEECDENVAKDWLEKAFEWWLKSAEQGHIEAQHWVVTCYKSGIGVYQDEKEMVKWLQKLVDQGDSNGLLQMGYCYACGAGVPMDEAKAIKWWRKAAKQGQPSAEFSLGEAYITGYGGVKENKENAIKWIKSSAEHGHKSAQEVYGKIEKWGFENVKKYLYPKIPFHTWRRHS